jgi:hypothetical protein
MTAALWEAPLSADPFRGLGVRKVPSSRRREYRPKPFDPGQRITWSQSVPPECRDRAGTIWSDGPLPKSVWAQPNDAPAGDMALVMLRTMTEHPAYPPSWQHDTIRRCEHLRASGGIFAEFRTETRNTYGKGNADYPYTVAYHCDRDCPEIRYETRECDDFEPRTGDVIRLLLSAEARGRSDLCRRCIYLTEPGQDTDSKEEHHATA